MRIGILGSGMMGDKLGKISARAVELRSYLDALQAETVEGKVM